MKDTQDPITAALDNRCIACPSADTPASCFVRPDDPETLCGSAGQCRRFRQMVCRQSAAHAQDRKALEAGDALADAAGCWICRAEPCIREACARWALRDEDDFAARTIAAYRAARSTS